jgi:hypothetical protein
MGVLTLSAKRRRPHVDRKDLVRQAREFLEGSGWPSATEQLRWMDSHPGGIPNAVMSQLGGFYQMIAREKGCVLCGARPILSLVGTAGYCARHQAQAKQHRRRGRNAVELQFAEGEEMFRESCNRRHDCRTAIGIEKRDRERKRRGRAQ